MANLHRVRNLKMRADKLAIHPYAQRERSNGHIKRLMEDFDLDAVGTIHAVEYPINGKTGTWVVDGQHRVLALLELGFGEWEVNVTVHVDVKDDRRASELFLRLNQRLLVGPYDRFINEVKAGDTTAVGINDIARQLGLSVGKNSGDGVLACPAALKKSYKHNDGKALHRALAMLTQAYGKKASALEGKLVEGVSIIAATHNGDLDEPSFVKKLSKYPGGASAILGDAKARAQFHRGSLSRSVASLLVDTYNLGRRIGKLDQI